MFMVGRPRVYPKGTPKTLMVSWKRLRKLMETFHRVVVEWSKKSDEQVEILTGYPCQISRILLMHPTLVQDRTPSSTVNGGKKHGKSSRVDKSFFKDAFFTHFLKESRNKHFPHTFRLRNQIRAP